MTAAQLRAAVEADCPRKPVMVPVDAEALNVRVINTAESMGTSSSTWRCHKCGFVPEMGQLLIPDRNAAQRLYCESYPFDS